MKVMCDLPCVHVTEEGFCTKGFITLSHLKLTEKSLECSRFKREEKEVKDGQ